MTAELTRRETLELSRDRLARELAYDGTETKDLAGLSRELRAVLAELDALPDAAAQPEPGSPDEIAARRERRRQEQAS